MPGTSSSKGIVEKIFVSWSGDQVEKWRCLTLSVLSVLSTLFQMYILVDVWHVREGDG